MSEGLGLADCEAVRQAVVAQPAAATTSLAFVAGSLVVLARGDGSTGVRIYAATMAAVGLGSWWYHGPQAAGAEAVHDATIGVLLAEAAGIPLIRRLRGDAPLVSAPGRLAWTWTAVGLLATAGGAYVLGRTESPLCRPESLLQAHGLWHLLAAGAFTAWGSALWTRTRTT